MSSSASPLRQNRSSAAYPHLRDTDLPHSSCVLILLLLSIIFQDPLAGLRAGFGAASDVIIPLRILCIFAERLSDGELTPVTDTNFLPTAYSGGWLPHLIKLSIQQSNPKLYSNCQFFPSQKACAMLKITQACHFTQFQYHPPAENLISADFSTIPPADSVYLQNRP